MDDSSYQGLMNRLQTINNTITSYLEQIGSLSQAIASDSANLRSAAIPGMFEDSRYPDRDERDHELADLVREANEFGGQWTAMTLFVGGSIIAGFLTGHTGYLEALANEIGRRDPSSNWANAYRESAATAGDRWRADHGDQKVRVSFVHLTDARLRTDGQWMPSEGGFAWRGRLRAVDGFVIGPIDGPGPEP